MSKKVIVCNVFTLAMAPNGGHLDYTPVSSQRARDIIVAAAAAGTLVQAVGHQQTAILANKSLNERARAVACDYHGGLIGNGHFEPQCRECALVDDDATLVAFNRVSVRLEDGDVLVIYQYTGPRLEEGVTTLPPGATVRWYYATYRTLFTPLTTES